MIEMVHDTWSVSLLEESCESLIRNAKPKILQVHRILKNIYLFFIGRNQHWVKKIMNG